MRSRHRPPTIACFLLWWVLTLALAGCGGSGTHHQISINGHHCSKTSEALQCVLPPVPHNLRLPLQGAPTARGIDFAWSCPSPRGWGFGASYFSPDGSKNWTRSCVNAYHAAGAKTVGVYESSQYRATQGFNAGYNDAFTARTQARAVGEPDNRPIDFAVDCDCSSASIFYYFVGAVSGTQKVLNVSRAQAIELTNAYGGYYQIKALFANHVVGHLNWQTYAWSGGLWLPASIAPLEQYLNDNSVDYDRAIAADYGQWPIAAPPPPPDPLAILDKTPRHFGSAVASEYNSVKAWDAAKCSSPARRDVCRSSYFHMRLLRDRLYWIAYHVPKAHPASFGTDFPNWTNGKGTRFQILLKRTN